MKKRKLKNKEFRLMEKVNKLEARLKKSKKCSKSCFFFKREYVTHNTCIVCPCRKNTPFFTKGDKYKYFRNKRTRRENFNECPF